MTKAMNFNPEDHCDLVHGLCNLFSEIDINGDMKMEWREFTQYVIDSVIQQSNENGAKAEGQNQNDILEQAYANHPARYSESQIMDSCIHDGPIRKLNYLNSLDRMLIIEEKTHSLKLVSPDFKKKEFIDLYSKEIDLYTKRDTGDDKFGKTKNTYFILAAVYNEKDEMMAICCSNQTIQLFNKYGAVFKRVKIINTVGVQYGVWYLEKHKAWITASKLPEIKPSTKNNQGLKEESSIFFLY